MEGGTTWQPNAPRRDPQQELSKAESLLANPPWQRLRKKRSSSADDASPDTGDVTPRSGATTPRAATTPRSAVETARRSLTPPPSFSPTERRASTLTRSWEKVASPVVTRRGRRSSKSIACTTSRQIGEVGRRDSRAGNHHPAGHKSTVAWTTSPRDPGGRHHVPSNNWDDNVKYAGKRCLLDFGGPKAAPGEIFPDTADFEIQKRAVLGYGGHQRGHWEIIERGHSQRKLAADCRRGGPPRDKTNWSTWDSDRQATAYGRKPPRTQQQEKKPEYLGP